MGLLKVTREGKKTKLVFFSKKLNKHIMLDLGDVQSPIKLSKTKEGYKLEAQLTELDPKEVERLRECLACSNSDYGG